MRLDDALPLRLPPQALEAEQTLIGALLFDNGAWDRIADLVSERDFYGADHRLIFAEITRTIEANNPADAITVSESLKRAGKLDEAGGLEYLAALSQTAPGSSNARRYAEIVRDKARLRAIVGMASELSEAAMLPGAAGAGELIATAEAKLLALQQHGTSDPIDAASVIPELVEYIDRRSQKPDSLSGISTGFAGLDKITSGLEPGQLIIVAARPGQGKTALALGIADHVSKAGEPALFFSLEMSIRELMLRNVSARAGVSMHAIRAGRVGDAGYSRITAATGTYRSSGLVIDDQPAIRLSTLRAKARRVQRARGLRLIVVDYLQLMRADGQEQKRVYEIGALSRGLKSLAKELHIPIIACAQLNRDVESRVDRRPLMSDLRDSGEVEQDADIIAMVHREEVYSPNASEWQGVAELLVRKNRNGPVGTVWLNFEEETMRFSDRHGGPVAKAAQPKAPPRRFADKSARGKDAAANQGRDDR